MSRWKTMLALLGVVALGATTTACGDDDDPMGPPPATGTATLRVVHASPDAPAVDIYAEGLATPLFTDLAYGSATEYVEVDEGTYNIQIRAAGAPASEAPAFETGDLQLMDGDVITAVAAGLLASQDAADRFRVLPLAEAFDMPASGYARVRVVHASPDAPTVDVDVGDDGSAEITGLARFANTGASGVDLPAGTLLSVGILAGGDRVTGFTLPALPAGVEIFAIATGLVGQSDIGAEDAFQLLAIGEDGSAGFVPQDPPVADSAMMRIVHASPDAPAVDIYVEGKVLPAISALSYGDASAYLTVPATSLNFQVRAHPSAVTDPVVYETGGLALSADQEITAVAAGFLGSTDTADEFRVLPLLEGFGPAASTRVRIVHASPDAPTVDIDVGDDGSSEITGLARFADTGAEGVVLPSGEALQVGVVASGGPRVTAFTTPALPDGEELFVIATGSTTRPADAADGFALLAVASSGSLGFIQQNPVVYGLHAGPDAPAVDIFAGSALLVENLAFGALSAPVQVPPADYTLDFYPTGTGPGTPAASFEIAPAAGGTYLAVAAGELSPEGSEAAFTLLPYAFEAADATGTALVRAIHASGDAPLVDVGTVDAGTGEIDGVVFPNLAFGESSLPSAGTEVPVASLLLGVAPQGNATPVATFDVTTTNGLQAIAVAAGALAPDAGEEGFRLILVLASDNPWAAAEVLPN
jgi:hypothetical protein